MTQGSVVPQVPEDYTIYILTIMSQEAPRSAKKSFILLVGMVTFPPVPLINLTVSPLAEPSYEKVQKCSVLQHTCWA